MVDLSELLSSIWGYEADSLLMKVLVDLIPKVVLVTLPSPNNP